MNAVRAFEAAARHVSFTKAAAELHVTHGAVSRQVSQLEEWLGVPLFKRSASQLVLTEPGRAYAAEVTSVLDRLAVASGQLQQQAAPSVAERQRTSNLHDALAAAAALDVPALAP